MTQKVLRTKQEKNRFLREYRKSVLTPREFATANGINYMTFIGWQRNKPKKGSTGSTTKEMAETSKPEMKEKRVMTTKAGGKLFVFEGSPEFLSQMMRSL